MIVALLAGAVAFLILRHLTLRIGGPFKPIRNEVEEVLAQVTLGAAAACLIAAVTIACAYSDRGM